MALATVRRCRHSGRQRRLSWRKAANIGRYVNPGPLGMKIQSADILRFTVLKQARMEFSPAMNVFIGRNGTGKSHLMKLLYAIIKSLPPAASPGRERIFQRDLANKLAGVFKPDDQAISRLVTRTTGRSKATVSVSTDCGRVAWRLTTPGNLHVDVVEASMSSPTVFLPSRETLAMYEGFVQAYENRELSFDETYKDVCTLLSGSLLLGPRLAHARALAEPLERILGGSVRLAGNRFYLASADGNLEAHLVAEGHRKIASLIHLVLNGSLLKNSILFWDEPEANLNPRLITVVATTLRKLAEFGVQIFVSTHDYLLASELSLAMEFSPLLKAEERVDIRFFGMSVTPGFQFKREACWPIWPTTTWLPNMPTTLIVRPNPCASCYG
jgi:energy-coupling factor transporter ATP-binding protein EcfA2